MTVILYTCQPGGGETCFRHSNKQEKEEVIPH